MTANTFWPTLRSVDWLIGFWTEQPGRTYIDRWKKCQLPHPLINSPIYQQRRRGAYWQTQIDGDRDGPCLFQIPYINIHLSIDWSINGQKKNTEGHISRTAGIGTHYLTDISKERQIPLSMDKKSRGDGDGTCLSPIRYINIHLLIDRSIKWSINIQTKLTEGNISRIVDIRTHYLTDLSTETQRPLSTDTNRQTSRVYLKS